MTLHERVFPLLDTMLRNAHTHASSLRCSAQSDSPFPLLTRALARANAPSLRVVPIVAPHRPLIADGRHAACILPAPRTAPLAAQRAPIWPGQIENRQEASTRRAAAAASRSS